MSTNYYVHTPDGQEIHLGKYAAGHQFMFRGYPERGVVDLDSWAAQFELGQIRAEHGAPVTVEELMDTVDEARRQWRRSPARPRSNQHDDENGNRFTNVEFC